MPTIFRHHVVIGAVTFNDPALKPIGAQHWGLDVMEGWKTGPEMNSRSTELGGEVDGEVAAGYFPLRARHMLLGGYVLAPDQETAEQMHDVILREALPRNQQILFVRHETVPKFLRVRREGPLETVWSMENGFRWSAPVMAEDPFKYALTPTVSSGGVSGGSHGGRTYPRVYPLTYTTTNEGDTGAVAIENVGTSPTYPYVFLFGPLVRGSWRLVNETTGGELWYDLGVPEGSILEIDFRNEVALLNGYPVTASITGEFWRVAAGVNLIRLYAEDNPGSGFSIQIYSAWE